MRTDCAWCRLVLSGDPADPAVSHGICPSCLTEQLVAAGLRGAEDRLDLLENCDVQGELASRPAAGLDVERDPGIWGGQLRSVP